MLSLSSPKPEACLRPEFMLGLSSYIRSYDDLVKLRDILTIDGDDGTKVAIERLKLIGIDKDKASFEEVRLWFLSYQFVFAKMNEVDHFEANLDAKMASIYVVASRADRMAVDYFEEMKTTFRDNFSVIDQLFEFRRRRDGFFFYCEEEIARERIYTKMSEDIEKEREIALSKRIRRFQTA
ncbi:MAG: hypothetical protein FJZ59_04315 [Chlamydiae bacterium]|nr:hypothetical protein [Chlamydiota bacterium]